MSYYVEPFTFTFNDTLITVDTGVTDIDCATLYDAIKLAQSSQEGIIYGRIGKGSGLDQLGPGVQVGLTVELLGTWQLKFPTGNYIARVAGGNLIGGPSGDPIAYSAGVQALLIQSANSTVVTTSGSGGGSTAAEIWSYSPRTLTSGGTTAIAAAVRTELNAELGRIDASISTRLPTSSYVTPPTVTAIRQEIDSNSTKLDVAVSTRLPTSSYVAPDNASITAIKAKTDNLPISPAAVSDIPTASQNAGAVRTELTTELSRIDVAVSTRLPTSSYVAPDNTSITAIKAKTDNLPALPAAKSDIPTTTQIATQVRTELTTELSRIDANITTRLPTSGYTAPDNASITAIKAKTDNLPASPATEQTAQKAVDAAKLAVAVSA